MTEIFQKKEVIDFLELYSKNPIGFLLLSGKNGTGKSFAAMYVYNNFSPFKLPQRDDEIAIFIKQATLKRKWCEEISKKGDMDYFFNKYNNTKLLILDDLGTTTPSDPFYEFLFEIVDMRKDQQENKGTIITTNLSIDEMREKFSDAFVSRVASGKCFRFEWDDRRFNSHYSSLNGSNLTNKKQNQSSEVQLAIS